jgi:hypothetical protein
VHLRAESLRLCRPLAVTLKVIAPAMYLPSVARYMAFRKANHRMELATEANHMDCSMHSAQCVARMMRWWETSELLQD